MKQFILITIIIFLPKLIFSQTLKGNISNNKGEPMEQVSIYLKSNSQIGTSTNKKGEFSINFDGTKLKQKDEIIISYLGYKTIYLNVSNLNWDNLYIKLEEQPIALAHTSVKAKVSKKQLDIIKDNQLKRLKEKLKLDFPDSDTTYNVSSTIKVLNNGNLLFSNNLFGDVRELQKNRAKKGDSTAIDINHIRGYLNQNIIQGIQQMKNNPIQTKKDKWKMDDSFYERINDSKEEQDKKSVNIHVSLWDMNPCIKKMLKGIDFSPKDWEITEQDEYLLFTYKEKMGFLGMFRVKNFLTLYVNPDTYDLQKLEERIQAQINIPIGFKLKGDVLRLLNVINFGEKEFEKFRLRHAKMDLVRNVLYTNSSKIPLEKNAIIYLELEDNKKNVLRGKSTAKTIIN